MISYKEIKCYNISFDDKIINAIQLCISEIKTNFFNRFEFLTCNYTNCLVYFVSKNLV